MDKNKLAIIKKYLQEKYPDRDVTEKYDFDLGAQTYKVSGDKDSLLLKVGENFVDDNDKSQIEAYLNEWNVADLLKQNDDVGILITGEGPKVFNRI